MSGAPLFDVVLRLAWGPALAAGFAGVAASAAGFAAVATLAAGLTGVAAPAAGLAGAPALGTGPVAVPPTPDHPPAGPLFPGECLDIEVGAWRPPAPASADSLALALPARVRLSDEPVWDVANTLGGGPAATATAETRTVRDTAGARAGWDSVAGGRPGDEAGAGWSAPRRIETAPGSLDAVHEERSWQQGPGGRLRLRFATRGSGVVVEARISVLDGARATAWWDLPIPDHSAPARLAPVACDAPLPEHARFRWDFPVAVPIAGAPDLELGAPLPPDADLPPNAFVSARAEERIRAHAEAEGTLAGAAFLSGAARIALEVADDGRLRRVVAAFREERVPRAVLLERLEAAWGPPDVMYGTTYRWLGRSLRYTMFAPTAEGWTVEMEVRTGLIAAGSR